MAVWILDMGGKKGPPTLEHMVWVLDHIVQLVLERALAAISTDCQTKRHQDLEMDSDLTGTVQSVGHSFYGYQYQQYLIVR